MDKASEEFRKFINAMGLWESGIPERMQAAEQEEREGEEGRAILSEYSVILAKHCTASLIKDPDRRRLNLHYREPSPYQFIEIETSEQEATTCCFNCFDTRFGALGERFLYHLQLIEGRWLVDKMEYVPSDGTSPFTMAV